jgi:hypothetical protein
MGKCKLRSLRESRRITQFECPILSEKLLSDEMSVREAAFCGFPTAGKDRPQRPNQEPSRRLAMLTER